MNSSFIPLGDRVCVVRDVAEDEITSTGLLVPGRYKDRPQMGTVIAVGEEVKTLKAGDRVLLQNFVGIGVSVNGQDMSIMHVEEVVGKFSHE